MIARHVFVLCAVSSTLMSLTAASGAAESGSTRGADGKIAFTRAGSSWPHYDIYVVQGDGTGVRRLTHTKQWRGDPAWSPDGRRIAFSVQTEARAGGGMWIMNEDGRALQRVLKDVTYPAWSPDGRRIAFERWDSTGSDPSLFILDLTSRKVRRLTGESCGIVGCHDQSPSWSPDGRRIAFLRDDEPSKPDLYLIAPDGTTRPRRLARTPGVSEERPAWSPNGQRLAFVARRGSDVGLYVANADGTGRRRLTRGFHVNSPTWSPDGRAIAFSRSGDIYVVGADGKGIRLLVRDGLEPAWVASL